MVFSCSKSIGSDTSNSGRSSTLLSILGRYKHSPWRGGYSLSRLFLSFYRHLLAGRPRGQALRLARQELAKTNPHPYYWAAFSLFGSPE